MWVNLLAEAVLDPSTSPIHASSSPIPLDRVAVVILGGGEGKRLYPLTHTRCKPAISFGGKYSLIDIPISHSLLAGFRKIFVVGQYLAYSLQKHLFHTYFHQGATESHIQLLIPEERQGSKIWYEGTADAIRQNLEYLSEVPADYFLILSGDQLYNLNFQKMLYWAAHTDAGMLMAVHPVTKKEARRMGVLQVCVDEGGALITDFCEKPEREDLLKAFCLDRRSLAQLGFSSAEGEERNYLGSMGIYLFKRQVLFDLLREDTRSDFGQHLIPTQLQKKNVHAFLYDGYWEDIGTIESYFHANLALTKLEVDHRSGLQCYDERNAIITKRYNLPGAKIAECSIDQSIICEGAVIEAKEIRHSIIGVRGLIGYGTSIADAIIFGNEYYQRVPLAEGEEPFCPGIGKHCRIQRAIIDENVRIGDHVTLLNQKGHVNFDATDGKIVVRDGIMVVPRGTHIPDRYIF